MVRTITADDAAELMGYADDLDELEQRAFLGVALQLAAAGALAGGVDDLGKNARAIVDEAGPREMAALASALDDLEPSGAAQLAKDKGEDCDWITIGSQKEAGEEKGKGGTPVCVGGDGKIAKGPSGMEGQAPNDPRGKRAARADDHKSKSPEQLGKELHDLATEMTSEASTSIPELFKAFDRKYPGMGRIGFDRVFASIANSLQLAGPGTEEHDDGIQLANRFYYFVVRPKPFQGVEGETKSINAPGGREAARSDLYGLIRKMTKRHSESVGAIWNRFRRDYSDASFDQFSELIGGLAGNLQLAGGADDEEHSPEEAVRIGNRNFTFVVRVR